MHRALFTLAAREETIAARAWYEKELSGLGERFLAALESTVERITANPMQFPVVYKNIRRALLPRFPYALLFVVESNDELTVIACFHGSRDPMCWRRL